MKIIEKLRRIKGRIEGFFFYTFNKPRINLIRTAFKYEPYDYGYMLDLIKSMAKYNEYFYKSDYCWSAESENVARDMKLLASLIDIVNENPLHYTYLPGKEYKCLVKVNLKNLHRFIKDSKLEEFYQKYPHELYELKAQYLMSKLIYYRLPYWWD